MISHDLMLQCLIADLDRIETRFIASSVDLGTPTVVHIQVGPNINAHDVASIIAQAPSNAVFVMHSKGSDPWSITAKTTKSMAELADSFVKLSKLNHDFKAEYLATNLTQPKAITYGPQRTTRKGKTRRW